MFKGLMKYKFESYINEANFMLLIIYVAKTISTIIRK